MESEKTGKSASQNRERGKTGKRVVRSASGASERDIRHVMERGEDGELEEEVEEK